MIEHVRADPVCGVRDEARAARGVELLQRDHQADVSLGDEVGQAHTVAAIAQRNRHDVAQIRLYELARRVAIVVIADAASELVLVLPRQRLDGLNASDVMGQRGGGVTVGAVVLGRGQIGHGG